MKQIFLFIALGIIFFSCKQTAMDANETYVIRLKPGEDLKASLTSFVKEKNIQAGWMVTCVGSLTDYSIRFANQPNASKDSGHFEIVSLTGTLSVNGSHLHISFQILPAKQ